MFPKPIAHAAPSSGQTLRAGGFNQLKGKALMDSPIQTLVDDIID